MKGWVGLLLLLAWGCSRAEPPPAATPTTLPAPVTPISQLLEQVTGQKPRIWHSSVYEPNQKPVAGLCVYLPDARLKAVLPDLQSRLPAGQQAFCSERNYGLRGQPDVLTVVAAQGPWEVLKIQHTDGANFDLTNEQVILRLQEWDRRVGLHLLGAGLDWAEFSIARLPEPIRPFAEEIYKFCPDIVDQGVGSVDELEKALRKDRTLYLWWD